MVHNLSNKRSHRIRIALIYVALITFQPTNKTYATGEATDRNTSDIVRDFFLSNLPTVCPKLVACASRSKNVNSDSVGGQSCCQCSCQEYCHSFNNCCPGKEEETVNIATVQPWQISCYSRPFELGDVTYFPQLIDSYWIVNKCPQNYRNDSVRHKCENPSLLILEENLPVVFAGDGEIIFRNKFCALCNKYDRFTDWTVQYNIMFDKLGQVNIGIHANINTYYNITAEHEAFNGWRVSFLPPETKPSFAFRCNKERISSCNITGMWGKYDWLTEQACMYSHLPYGNYKNPYCGICNGNYLDLCFGPTQKFSPYSIQYLVDYRDTGGSNNEVCLDGESDDLKCGANHIFDNFQKRCRPIYCSKFQVQTSGGKCINLMQKMIWGRIDLFLQISALNAFVSDLTSSAKIAIAQNYYIEFVKPLKPEIAYHTSVDTMPFPNSGVVLLVTSLVLFVLPGDFEDDIMTMLYQRVKKLSEFSFYSNGKLGEYIVDFATQFQWNETTGLVVDMRSNSSLSNIYRSKSIKQFPKNLLTKQLFCPQLRLQSGEVRDFIFKIVILSTNKTLYENEFQRTGPHDNGSHGFIICVDDYLPVVHCRNEGSNLTRNTELRKITTLMSVLFVTVNKILID